MITSLLALIFFYLIVKFIACIEKFMPKAIAKAAKIKLSYLEWQGFFQFWMGSFPDILLASSISYFNMTKYAFDDPLSYFISFLSFVISIVGLVIPFLYLINAHKDHIKEVREEMDNEIEENKEEIDNEVKENKEENKS